MLLREHDKAIRDAKKERKSHSHIAALRSKRDSVHVQLARELCDELDNGNDGSLNDEKDEAPRDGNDEEGEMFASFMEDQRQRAFAAAALLRRHDESITKAKTDGRDSAHVIALETKRDAPRCFRS